MCGIVGIYDIKNRSVDLASLKRMTDSIIHRGPDGEGQWINDSKIIGFGHRRLSIIDLTEGGHQPMHYQGRYTITFNGEIYNYIELKDQLKQSGYNFATNSDTEVILALYDLKKEKCLSDLDGMFAFAIWDEEEQILFCARDRFGEKPFHYFWDQEKFIFASEIKALFKGGVPKEVSKKNLQEFLDQYLIERGAETFFNKVTKLMQGHYLLIKNKRLTIKKYYDIDLKKSFQHQSDEAYAKGFKTLFKTSIERRLRSDVPVGSSLSGGLDSSSIVCFVRKHLGETAIQKTFSARFKNHKNDEGKWMKLVSDYAKTEHHEVYPDINEIEKDIQKMIYHHEYPFGSSSQCAWWYVMKIAKENNITVLLDGQGADEYLSGYPIMKNFLLMEHLFHFRFKKFRDARRGYKKIYGEQYPLGKMLWLHPLLKLVHHPKSVFKNAFTFKQRLKYETFFRLQELLAYADRTSMAFSLEVRLPFLYHELVEYSLQLPDEQLYHNGITKYVLRNAIKGEVPDEIVHRYDKIGYDPPQNEWEKRLIDEEKVNAYLKSKKYSPGNSRWRNYIASIFLKEFDE